MLPRVVCSLKVGDTVGKKDVVTTGSKRGQHKEVLDSTTGQLLGPGCVHKPREDEITNVRRLNVFD